MPQSEILFIGTGRRIDVAALASRRFQTATLDSRPIKGKSGLSKLGALLHLPLSLWNAIGLVRKFKPDVALGVGGYVTGPVIVAAKLLGIKTCIHEQNSVPGMANRLLGKIVDTIFVSIPGSETYFAGAKTILTGNPVRKELIETSQKKQKNEEIVVAVLGGSQGAHKVNVLVTEAFTCLAGRLPENIKVIHQTGAHDKDWVLAIYQNKKIKAEVADFFTNMAEIYQQADLIISRAGATTIAEITVSGKPAILIPFPYATDNHQRKNGNFLVAKGAALLFAEQELTGEKLADEIGALLAQPEARKKMSQAAHQLAKPQATGTIIDACFALVN